MPLSICIDDGFHQSVTGAETDALGLADIEELSLKLIEGDSDAETLSDSDGESEGDTEAEID